MTLPIEFTPAASTAQATSQSQQTDGATGAFTAALQSSSENTIDLNDIFERAAQKYGVDVNLLKAIGKIESEYQPNAVSYAGAMGIMQLMPDTAKHLGVADPFDPEQNIMGAAKLLAEHIEQYDGNLELAIAAYNCGVGTVAKYGGEIPPFTQGYIKKINEVLQGDLNVPALAAGASQVVSSASAQTAGKELEYTVSGKNELLESMSLMLMYKIMEKMSKSGDEDEKAIF